MRVLFASAGVVALDQYSKSLIRQNLSLYDSISVLGNFFRLTYVENSGIVFGIGVGNALPLLTVISAIASVMIVYFLYRERDRMLASRLGLAMVLGGAIGNLIDRVQYSRVVDFLDFGIGGYRFFIFNLADTFVTVGVGLYLLVNLIYPQLPVAAEAEPEES